MHSYHPVSLDGTHTFTTDWTPSPPRVECPECRATVPLARIKDGEHEGEWIIRGHQTPGDTYGCNPRIIYDVTAKPRPFYREDGGAN